MPSRTGSCDCYRERFQKGRQVLWFMPWKRNEATAATSNRSARLGPRRGRSALRPSVRRPDLSGTEHPPQQFRSQPRRNGKPTKHQDRRLPGRLRLLLTERALRHRPEGHAADGQSGRGRNRAARQGCWRDALLHGRRLAQSERPRPREGLRYGQRGERPRHGDLRHARHADPRAGAQLSEAGLDFYNHNVDTSPEFYGKIITTRTLQDRIDTLAHVRDAGIKVCCGGIVGMGERVEDRLGMLILLANLPAIRRVCRSTSGTRSRACRSTTPRSFPIRSRWCG